MLPFIKILSVAELFFAGLLFFFAVFIGVNSGGEIDNDVIFGMLFFVSCSVVSIFCAISLRRQLILKVAGQLIFVSLILFLYLYLFTSILVYDL